MRSRNRVNKFNSYVGSSLPREPVPRIPETATSTFGGIVLNLPASVKIQYPPRRMKSQLTNESINHYNLSKRDVNNINKDKTYH